ncbi:MAG: hypothetical protein A2033_00045 [Bacteroidetes bacterium GWA2_31_9]|nr:MAG: hypothetical protein A2033_00045 [Bacteroidetes bacterium GWA2_31_9]
MAEKKLKVVYKPKADKQIYRIMMYINEMGYPETALNFAERLYQFGNSLGFIPEKFPICRHERYAKRLLHCAVFEHNYIFIYKTVRSQLVIYNIIHCSRIQ